jgi:hypothetical protein
MGYHPEIETLLRQYGATDIQNTRG